MSETPKNADQLVKEPLKLPLKRFQLALHKFTDVAIPLHLQLLTKHKDNIRKYQTLGEWERVHHEQVNASRTVQQLKADIWEVDKVRQQVREQDIAAFDKRVNPVKIQALDAVHEFIEEHREVSDPSSLLLGSKRGSVVASEGNGRTDEPSVNGLDDCVDNQEPEVVQFETQVSPQKAAAVSSSWRKLHTDLLGLNQMIKMFSGSVHSQQPMVDSIESNIEDTHANVQQGAMQLSKATKLQAVMYPLTGALIGCLAGPVGMLAGAKLGFAAAVGGGLIGFQSGRYLKQRREKVADIELESLSQNQKGSISLPDLTQVPTSTRRSSSPTRTTALPTSNSGSVHCS